MTNVEEARRKLAEVAELLQPEKVPTFARNGTDAAPVLDVLSDLMSLAAQHAVVDWEVRTTFGEPFEMPGPGGTVRYLPTGIVTYTARVTVRVPPDPHPEVPVETCAYGCCKRAS